MSTQNITKYIRDIKKNIFSTTADDGLLAYAVDTDQFMIADGGGWLVYGTDKTVGTYQLPGTSVNVSKSCLAHLDANDGSSLRNDRGVAPSDGDTIKHWSCQQNGGPWDLTQRVSPMQPRYKATGINGKPTIHFDNKPNREPVYMMTERPEQLNKVYKNGLTSIMVVNMLPSYDNWLDVSADPDNNVNNKDENFQTQNVLWSHAASESDLRYMNRMLGLRLDHTTDYYSYIYRKGFPGSTSSLDDETGVMHIGAGSSYLDIVNGGPDIRNEAFILIDITSGGTHYQSSIPEYRSTTIGGSWQKHTTYMSSSQTGKSLMQGLKLGMGTSYSTAARAEFSEVLFFDGVITKSDLNDIGSHLSNKWGVKWKNFSV